MLNRNHFIWTVAFVIITAALMWPAFWNGYPILFADTGGYLARPFEGTLAFGRSALYGAFLAAGMKLDFWPNVITQAALCAFVLIATLRAHGVGRPLTVTFVAVALAVLTGLPFYVAQLVPDVFVAIAVLSLYLLAFRRAGISPATRYGLAAVIAFAVASHMTILALALVMLAAFAILRMLPHPLPRPALTWPAGALAAGIALALVSNFAIAGQLRFTPGGTSFLFGRLIQDGIVPRYLAEHCPDPSIRLCAYRGEMADTADGWLWGNDTPFWKLGGPEGNADEERRIILATLRLYPIEHIRTALRATFEQFFMARTMTSLSRLRQPSRHGDFVPARTRTLAAFGGGPPAARGRARLVAFQCRAPAGRLCRRRVAAGHHRPRRPAAAFRRRRRLLRSPLCSRSWPMPRFPEFSQILSTVIRAASCGLRP